MQETCYQTMVRNYSITARKCYELTTRDMELVVSAPDALFTQTPVGDQRSRVAKSGRQDSWYIIVIGETGLTAIVRKLGVGEPTEGRENEYTEKQRRKPFIRNLRLHRMYHFQSFCFFNQWP
jgi:hypothetical protein